MYMYLHLQAVGFVKLNCLSIICHAVFLFFLSAYLTHARGQVSHSQLMCVPSVLRFRNYILASAVSNFLYTVCKEKQKMTHLKQVCEKLKF